VPLRNYSLTHSRRQPLVQPTDSSSESACCLLPSTRTTAIYYYYSTRKLTLILPFHAGRRAEWIYRHSSKSVRCTACTGCRGKHNPHPRGIRSCNLSHHIKLLRTTALCHRHSVPLSLLVQNWRTTLAAHVT